jgi:predicted Zn-dependent protease with MMP-like domain
LIDGTTVSGAVDDRIATGTGVELTLENFWSSPDAEDEVIAVTRGRALELVESVPWSEEEGDLAQVEFAPEIEISLTIWVVKGPWEEGYDHAVEQLLTLDSLWWQERVGIRRGAIELVDATATNNAGFYHQFDCSDRQALEQTIGSRPGRINVYRVESVSGTPFAAEACGLGSGFVALGQSTSSDILVHEIGHSFGLEHPQGIAGLGEENVMADLSSQRAFLTEGQVFRAHVDPGSVINSLYGARPGEPVRSCPHAAASATCPPLATRIWPDVSASPVEPEPQAVPPQPEELVEGWLLRDCEVGGADVRKGLRKQADRVVELSLAAFHEGPPKALVARVERAARARFGLRRRALGDPHRWGLSHIDLARVVEISEADYVARELTRFTLRYRTQALRGLLVVRPDLAHPLLAEAAADAGSPLREIADRLRESHSPD